MDVVGVRYIYHVKFIYHGSYINVSDTISVTIVKTWSFITQYYSKY